MWSRLDLAAEHWGDYSDCMILEMGMLATPLPTVVLVIVVVVAIAVVLYREMKRR